MTPHPTVPWINLGSSGLKISNVIIGCMTFGKKSAQEWFIEDEDEVFAILTRAYELGIRTFDTADVYSNGASERLLGKWIQKNKIKRDKIVILSKVFNPVDEDLDELLSRRMDGLTPQEEIEILNSQGLSRKHIMDAAKNSVERLGTYMDVYQIHRFDQSTPIEETMKALNDVVEAGYTRYIGASTMRAVEFVSMQHIAELHGWHKFISMQSQYSLLCREDEHEMNYYCDKTGVGLIPWAPLADGLLARPVPLTVDEPNLTSRQRSSRWAKIISASDESRAADVEIIARVEKIAKERCVPMAAVATAWVLAKGAMPIVGVSSTQRVEQLVIGANLVLTDDEVKYLEEPYTPRLRAHT